MRQTLRCGNRRYQMNCSHSSSSQRKWDEALAEPVIYSLLKGFDPSLVDTLFSSYAFSPLIPKAVCQGALMAFLSLSQPLLRLFFSRSGEEWNGKERNKFVLAWTVWRYEHHFVFPRISAKSQMFLIKSSLMAFFVCQIIHEVCDLCRVTVWVKNKHRPMNSFCSFCTFGPNLSHISHLTLFKNIYFSVSTLSRLLFCEINI